MTPEAHPLHADRRDAGLLAGTRAPAPKPAVGSGGPTSGWHLPSRNRAAAWVRPDDTPGLDEEEKTHAGRSSVGKGLREPGGPLTIRSLVYDRRCRSGTRGCLLENQKARRPGSDAAHVTDLLTSASAARTAVGRTLAGGESSRPAESAFDALDAEFGAPGASQEPGCCKHHSSSHVTGGGAARIGQKHASHGVVADDWFRLLTTVDQRLCIGDTGLVPIPGRTCRC
jgi:hypothetical protein